MKELLELPKDNRPAFITMVDIDEVVMEACAEHMPQVNIFNVILRNNNN